MNALNVLHCEIYVIIIHHMKGNLDASICIYVLEIFPHISSLYMDGQWTDMSV